MNKTQLQALSTKTGIDFVKVFESSEKIIKFEKTSAFGRIVETGKDLLDTILIVVNEIEKVGNIPGQEKLEIAVEALDALITFPPILSAFERPLYRILITIVVEMLNKYAWKAIDDIIGKTKDKINTSI